MSGEFWQRLILFIIVVVVTDTLLYFGLRRIFTRRKNPGSKGKRYTQIFLAITLGFALYALIHFLILRISAGGPDIYRQYFVITGVFLALYVPKIIIVIFILAEHLIIFLLQLLSFVAQNRRHYDFVKRVRKIKVISWLGVIAGLGMMAYVIYGMLYTRVDFQINRQTVRCSKLPSAFDGLKIVFFSDTHLGSFFNHKDVQNGIELLLAENPDLVLFGGDMINTDAVEVRPYIEMFAAIKPPLGKYAVLGNHDMNDYLKFGKVKSTEEIVSELTVQQKKMGFSLLRNEHIYIYRGRDSIALIGTDPWGLKPFKQSGDLVSATKHLGAHVFKILLSHNPDHWAQQVIGKTNIDLTLAGHTHAAQIGIYTTNIRWSPIALKYPFWAGLYNHGKQYLYVNPGFGYLGFPGRIGVPPEITVITLLKN